MKTTHQTPREAYVREHWDQNGHIYYLVIDPEGNELYQTKDMCEAHRDAELYNTACLGLK